MTKLSSSLLPLSNRHHVSTPNSSPMTSHRSFPQRFQHYRPKIAIRRFTILLWSLTVLVFLGLMWRLFNEGNGASDEKINAGRTNSLVNHAAHDSLHVWRWEILSGHYPSRDLPKPIVTTLRDRSINNPALPNEAISASNSRFPLIGTGFKREYLQTSGQFRSNQNSSTAFLYPKRPPPGSIADFDVIMRICDYKNRRTSRDCLENLRHGVGLDDTDSLQRDTNLNVPEPYIYIERENGRDYRPADITPSINIPSQIMNPSPLSYYTHSDLVTSLLRLDTNNTATFTSAAQSSSWPCDPNHPRIFHLFWSGPFTSHPYMAILSFLYTQNLGLDQDPKRQPFCKPRLWVWIWDSHSLSSDANTERELHRTLALNMWSRPFLHPRFHDIVEFKWWDVSRHLDEMGDILEGWRDVLGLKNGDNTSIVVTNEGKPHDKSSAGFVTIVSDMARFVITYLYGGIYIDADTIFLRDWEELWGYRGAFAYRWSHIKNEYNTAVLKMNKGSMLGEMLIRAARRGHMRKKWWEWGRRNNMMGMEFHPKEGISKYVEEMDLVLPVESSGRKGLLWMLPVALFDPAWLATDGYETKRMTVPGFKSFSDFFETPSSLRHEAELLGLNFGFYRGAYAYHWHNQWKTPFDKEQEYPNWGNKLTEYTNELEKLYPSLEFHLTHAPENRLPSRPVHALQSDGSGIVSYFSFWKWLWPWQHSEILAEDNSLPWSAVIKRTMEAFIRGEAPNVYGEYFVW